MRSLQGGSSFCARAWACPKASPAWPLTLSASIWTSIPHLHALVADGLFAPLGVFHVMPETGLKPLEELFGARVIPASASGSILYRSGINEKIGRNFEVFTDWGLCRRDHPTDSRQEIQLVRY